MTAGGVDNRSRHPQPPHVPVLYAQVLEGLRVRADGIYLDDPCEGELFALLGQIPDTLADAADTVARLDRHATARHTATSSA